MSRHQRVTLRRLGLVLLRSLVVGAFAGVVGGGLIFFVFGFIGFAGAPISTKIANGWNALLDPGLGRGLAVGAAIAVGLIAVTAIWTLLARRFDPHGARPWLSFLAGAMVVLYNLESFRSSAGWDLAGIATVAGIALLVGGIVWFVSLWELKDWPWAVSEAETDGDAIGLPARKTGNGGEMGTAPRS